MLYLASPYSHPDPIVIQHRVEAVCVVAVELMKAGHVVFSPIAHSAMLVALGNAPESHNFWMRQDLPVLRMCGRLAILLLDGWNKSVGIQNEIEQARACGMSISYIHPSAPTVFHNKPGDV